MASNCRKRRLRPRAVQQVGASCTGCDHDRALPG
jgi:hypothetical protein